MKNIEVKVNRNTSMVYLENTILGNEGENLQGDIIFTFINDFVDGQARLEYETEGEKRYLFLTKERQTYKTPIKSILTKNGAINMQLVITEGVNEDEIPIFKSNVFYVVCNNSLNAEIEQPEEYPNWIEVANTKLNEFEQGLVEIKTQSMYAKEQGDYAKEEAEKVDEVVDYVVATSEQAKEISEKAETIAKGRATGYVFDTLEDLEVWLLIEENASKLVLGDNLYIRAVGVPDYWWDGISKQVLETQKVDLTEYVKNTDYVTSSKAGIVKIGSGLGIWLNANNELYVAKSSNAEIDAKVNNYKPIVPSNLDYAVGSVKASETQSGTIKAWISTEDGETGLNISTEV